ncbi:MULTISPECIES: hypothetical protein [unclassified Xanthobacter]|uniref:hypothetical protein n=1 Tax=unclassified Xanthobacter TaxID=2623496 RepID=UPI001F22C1DC|nr:MULTISPECIES: hypothetical protein [unclassified Xanthobacter]
MDLHVLAEEVASGQVPALSIRQPYPHHIFHDGKDVENRDWATKRRGWFMVHAGVSTAEIDLEDERERALPRGGIVGMARIIDCVTQMDSDWFFGRHGFVLRDAFPLPLLPCNGAQGFFNVPPDIRAAVAAAIRGMCEDTRATAEILLASGVSPAAVESAARPWPGR